VSVSRNVRIGQRRREVVVEDADLAAIVDGHRAGESGPVVGRLVRRSVAPSNSSRVTPPGSPFDSPI
jgi:hypothetical protein